MNKYFVTILAILFSWKTALSQTNDSSAGEESYEYTESQEEYNEESFNDEQATVEDVYHNPVTPEELSAKTGSDADDINAKRFKHEEWQRVVNGEDFSESVSPKKRREGKNAMSDENEGGKTSGQRVRDHDEDDDENEEQDFEHSSSNSLSSTLSPIVKYFFYALVIGIVGYILSIVIKNTSIKGSGKKIVKPNYAEATATVEDIRELEIDRLLREALAAGNYRIVIRIYFLGLLQKLDEGGLIHWKKDKTNRDYLAELISNSNYFEDMQRLTRAYELVWYGDHNLSAPVYETLISDFKSVDEKLKTSKAE